MILESIMYGSFVCCLGFGLWCAIDEAKLMIKEFRHG